MPTHQGYDQTSEANQRRQARYSLKHRDPARYEQLDRILARSSRKRRGRKLVVFAALAGIAGALVYLSL